MGAVLIRDALPGELDQVGAVRVGAYQAGGFLAPGSDYAPRLRALGADGTGQILVAIMAGRVVGTVMLQYWPDTEPIVTGPDEAEVRALSVASDAQGQGAGGALLEAAIGRAAARGVRHLVLCTQPDMHAAHHLYTAAGFSRLPQRDWSPVPELTLLAYGLRLDQASSAASA